MLTGLNSDFFKFEGGRISEFSCEFIKADFPSAFEHRAYALIRGNTFVASPPDHIHDPTAIEEVNDINSLHHALETVRVDLRILNNDCTHRLLLASRAAADQLLELNTVLRLEADNNKRVRPKLEVAATAVLPRHGQESALLGADKVPYPVDLAILFDLVVHEVSLTAARGKFLAIARLVEKYDDRLLFLVFIDESTHL